LQTLFELPPPFPQTVLVYSTELRDTVVYVLESETVEDVMIGLGDQFTSAPLALKLPAQHAGIAPIGKAEKGIIVENLF
jgi:hypothetical protein